MDSERTNTSPHRTVGTWLTWASLVLVLGFAGVALSTDLLDGLSITSGPFATTVGTIGIALLAMTIFERPPSWRRRVLPASIAGVVIVVCIIAIALNHLRIISDAYPPTFLLWVFLGMFAVALVPLGWRRCDWNTRRLSIAAALIMPFAAFTLINVHYDYWPTLGSITGAPLPDQASARDISSAVAASPDANGNVPNAPTNGKGVLTSIDIPSTTSGFSHRSAMEYLPPAFFTAQRTELPVLIMLGGSPGEPSEWPRTGVVATIDDFAAAHNGEAPVLVFPDYNGSFTKDSECVDGPSGKAETYLTVDLPLFVRTTLRLNPSPDHFGIVGFSEGGTCAVSLTIGHPDLFARLVSFSGQISPVLRTPSDTLNSLYGGDQAAMDSHDSLAILAQHSFPDVWAWFDADSHHVSDQSRIVNAAEAAKMHVTARAVAGTHTMSLAQRGFADILPELCKTMGITS